MNVNFLVIRDRAARNEKVSGGKTAIETAERKPAPKLGCYGVGIWASS